MRHGVVGVVLLSVCAFVVAAQPRASASEYRVSPELSSVTFTVYKWGVLKEQGRFRAVRGGIVYDPERPQLSSVDILVDVASIDTNNQSRDGVLRSDDFFDAARYPIMRFVSHSVTARADGSLAVTGDLTIRGVTKRMEVVAKVAGVRRVDGVGQVAGFEANFQIDRMAFGVTGTRWSGSRLVISQEVNVSLVIAASDRPLYGQR